MKDDMAIKLNERRSGYKKQKKTTGIKLIRVRKNLKWIANKEKQDF